MSHQAPPYAESTYATEIVRETLEDGSTVYVASHPELDGCMAHGDTVDEARANLAEAFQLSMEHLAEYELPIPAPRARLVVHRAQNTVVSEVASSGTLFQVNLSASATSVPSSLAIGMPDWLIQRLAFDAPASSIVESGELGKSVPRAS